MPQSDSRLLSPGTLVDHYRLTRPIARGGMGEVYLARDTRLGRRVAIKIIRTEHEGSDAATNALLFEAQTIARFSHPNIVTVYAVGEYAGRPYLALEYLEGDNLEDRLLERRPSLGEAVRIVHAIAGAVGVAHEHGVLHLDLKPANVIIPADGRLRVLDFGLAKIVRETHQGATTDEHSATGGWGTPAYTAPEQWRRREPTAATDVWSLGIMLFELLSGRLPYEHPSPAETGRSICSEDPAPSLAAIADVPPETAELVARCLQKDPEARPTAVEVYEALAESLGASAMSSVEESPFRGLLPFTTRHAALFFGRDAEIAAFVERARHHGVLPIVGPSGAGKSSFVQAGVIPRLREQGEWVVLRLRPGARPFDTLVDRLRRRDAPTGALQADDDVEPWASTSVASASISDAGVVESAKITPTPGLALDEDPAELVQQLIETPRRLALLLRRLADETGRNVLLVVEQLEQLLTVVDDERVRRSFLTALCTAADDALEPVRVIFTVRDDALGRIATGPEVRDALSNMTVIQSLDAGALRQVLVAPVEALGYRYEDPEIVERMSEAVRGEPGSLPLLQFAAQKLWEQRDTERRLLLTSTYEAMGGVEGALARHADGVIDTMSDDERRVARELLLRLVTPDRVRRAIGISRAKEGLGEDVDDVLDRLAQARLVTVTRGRDTQGPRVELAHESLVTRWSTLARWLDEARGELRFLAEVGSAAELWEGRGRRLEELWRGDALNDAIRRRKRLTSAPPAIVEEYLGAALRRERGRQRRRRASVIAVVAVSLAIAAAGSFAAFTIADKEQLAVQARDRAEHQRAEALREAATAAASGGDLLAARAKLRVALTAEDTLQGRALWRDLRDDPRVWQKGLSSLVYDAAFSPDGRSVAAACQDTSIYIVDVVTRDVAILRGADDQVNSIAWSPDGRTLASAGWSGSVILWDVETQRATHRLAGHDNNVHGLAYSPDGRWLASSGVDATVRLWNAETGASGPVLPAGASTLALAFSPDGTHLAAATEEGVRMWTMLHKDPRQFGGGSLRSIVFSRDGTRLAAGSLDAVAYVWNVADAFPLAVLRGHGASVDGVAFDATGERIITGSSDKTIRISRISTGELLRTLEGHDAGLTSIDLDGDATRLVTSSRDRTVRLWDLQRERIRDDARGHEAGVYRVAFSPDGRSVASGSGDKSIRLWDVATGEQRSVFHGHREGVDSLAFSPDGTTIASGSIDLTVRLWDVESGTERRVFNGHTARVWDVDFSSDGARLASASRDGSVRVWDARSGVQTQVFRGHEGAVYGASLSPNGSRVATGGADHTVRLWEVGRSAPLQIFEGHNAPVHGVAFFPDGEWIASGGDDKKVRLWNVVDGTNRELGPHGGRVYWLAVDEQGATVAAPASDGGVTLWSVDGAQERTVLRGHRDEANTAAFSADGTLVATAGDDGTVRLWESTSGRPFWHAPIMLIDPPVLYSHEGWVPLDPAAIAEAPKASEWRRAVERDALRGAYHRDGKACLVTHGHQLQWWTLDEDRQVAGTEQVSLLDVRAASTGCIARAADRAIWLDAEGADLLPVESPIRAIEVIEGPGGPRLLIANAFDLIEIDPDGSRREATPIDPGVTAVTRVGADIVLGFHDGNLRRRSTADGEGAQHSFEDVPASAVERLVAGPEGIVVAGFANGSVGMWSLETGGRLASGRLHGRIVHLAVDGGFLHAATDLGHALRWDLDVLVNDYCAVLREVWARVPVVWSEGRPIVEPPPIAHRCSVRE